eukprot:scaffold59896_cov37-Phaeocystis_antarctica.AAC.1
MALNLTMRAVYCSEAKERHLRSMTSSISGVSSSFFRSCLRRAGLRLSGRGQGRGQGQGQGGGRGQGQGQGQGRGRGQGQGRGLGRVPDDELLYGGRVAILVGDLKRLLVLQRQDDPVE